VGTGGIISGSFGASAIALGLKTVLLGISAGTFTGLDLDAPGPTPIFGNAALDALFEAVLAALVLVTILLAAFAMAQEAQKRPYGTLSSVTARVRWRWLAVCLALAAGFCAVLVGASLLLGYSVDGSAIAETMNTDATSRGWWQAAQLPQLIIGIVLIEYVFRGWILQAVGACTLETRHGPVGRAFGVVFGTPWPAIVISAALFACMVDYGGGGFTLFVFGVVVGWLAVRTGGLEASIALALVYLVGVGLRTDDGEDLPWRHVITIGAVLVFAAASVWLARRQHVQTVSAAPQGRPPEISASKSAQKSARHRSHL
jgi:membrane protease YdiL (CAAX protease family)